MLPSAQALLPPTTAHLLGTNDIGQDLLSLWLWGARSSLLVALGVALLSTGLSWAVGLVAGMWPRAEVPLVGLIDLLLALPALPLYLLVIALLGPHLLTVVIVLGLLSWPAFARIVRAQVQATRTHHSLRPPTRSERDARVSRCCMCCQPRSVCCQPSSC